MAADKAASTAETKVSYTSLDKKKQLALLCMARLVEPLAATSIHSYLFFQLRSFNPSASEAMISTEAGILIGAKTAAQVCTGILWGRVADWDLGGRKLVLLVGLLTSCVACTGYGFSTTFTSAVAWQIVAGAFNSNISIVRCAVAESYPEKKYRVRALMLLPLCANGGMLVGPLIGGLLSSNSGSNRDSRYPYAIPNILIAALYLTAALGVFFFMEETLPTYNRDDNIAYRAWNRLRKLVRRTQTENEHYYQRVDSDEQPSPTTSGPSTNELSDRSMASPTEPPKSVVSRIFTFNVFCTMLAHFIISGHLGTFATLWTIFLSTPVESVSGTHHNTPFKFDGGLGLEPRYVGIVMSILGAIVVVLQMVVYPKLSDRFGTLKVWNAALYAFPVAYMLAPYPALVASETFPSGQVAPKWLAMLFILLVFGIGRTGVTPATTLLINDCTPHPSVRATIHSVATVLGNLARSIFPILALWIYGQGLRIGVVGLGFWCLTGLSITSCFASRWIKDGSAEQD